MRRTVRHRLWLLGGVVLLLATAGWQWRQDAKEAPGTLLPLDPEAITQIALGFRGHPTERYARHDGHWWHVDAKQSPADDGHLGELARLAAAPVVSWRPASDFNAARIGLEPPVATLTLDGRTMAFGSTTAIAPMNYVRVGDRIALVSVRDTPRPTRADALSAD